VWRWDNTEPFGDSVPNGDPGNTGSVFDFPMEELERMGASAEVRREMKELAARHPNSKRGDRRLVPCIYPRMRFLGLFPVELSGIVFFFPPQLRRRVAGGKLDVGCGALVLLDRTGQVVMPRPTLG
jgi:hypothetical protein